MTEHDEPGTDSPENCDPKAVTRAERAAVAPPGFFVGVGALVLMLSVPMFLLGIGVVEADEPVHWALRLFLAAFTGIFLIIGALLFFGGVYLAVNVSVPGTAPWILRFPIMLLKRITWAGFGSSVMYALLAAQFWALRYIPEPPFGIGGEMFEQWATLEFISIHATAFLGTVLALPIGGMYNKIRYGVFSGLLLLYAAIVLTILEPLQAILFFYLVCAKFSDYLFRSATPEEIAKLTLRWGLMFMLFVVVIWDQAFLEGAKTFDTAMRYFGVLAILELFALTEVPILAKKAERSAVEPGNQ